MIMNVPYNITSRGLWNAALVTNIVTAVLVYAGSKNTWLALAAHQLGLMLGMLHCSMLMYFEEKQKKAEAAEAEALDHTTVVMPEPRHETGDRFAAPHSRFTAAGYALPQILGFIVCLLGTLLTIPVIYFIFITVMGAQEPRW